jgi:soluble lytic murein transglycosylase-like protein
MVSTSNSEHKTVTVLALAALAATIFIVGSGRAFAPDRDAACLAPADAAGEAQASTEEPRPLDPAQRALVDYLSRRFFISAGATELMVGAAHRAAQTVGLDPLLVLAVISVESRFNPIAESVMGAKGLMQIIPKYHRAKLLEHGGDEAVFDPESNILVGTRILQEYIYRTGTQEAGLQSYNGAARDGSAQYAQKVMAERDRLEQVVRSALSRHRAAATATVSRGG